MNFLCSYNLFEQACWSLNVGLIEGGISGEASVIETDEAVA